MFVSPERFDPEFDLLEDMARVSGRPLSISLLQRVGATEQWRQILGRIERANAAGLTVRAQVATRGIGVILGLDATFHPFIGHPSYKAVARLPLEERVRELARPEVRARLLAETAGAGRGRRQPGAAAGRQAARGVRPGGDEPVPARRSAGLRAAARGVDVRRGDARGAAADRGRVRRAARGRRAAAAVLPDLQLRVGRRSPRSARCCATRTRSSGSATAARTSARSATRASRRSCSRTGCATAARCRSRRRSAS